MQHHLPYEITQCYLAPDTGECTYLFVITSVHLASWLVLNKDSNYVKTEINNKPLLVFYSILNLKNKAEKAEQLHRANNKRWLHQINFK